MTSAATGSGNALPSYKRPPVDEVVCGFRFERLRGLKVPHIGLLWEKFRNEYPTVQHAIPIASDVGESLRHAYHFERGGDTNHVWSGR